MAGQLDNQYNIYDTGCDKQLVRGAMDAVDIPGLDPSLNSPATTVDGTGFGGGLVDPVEGLTQPTSIANGELAAVLFSGKQSFEDTTAGYRMGIDNTTYKWIVGDANNSVDWNVTTANVLTVKGAISASTIDIGGSDATSFHVDVNGNMWLGATTLASAPFSVTNTGLVTSTSAVIGGWNVIPGYIYNLQSGTPTSTPTDGIVLASGNEALTVYENANKRVELGYLSSGVYGLKVYDDNGTTVIFEMSDVQKLVSGAPMFVDTRFMLTNCLSAFASSINGAGSVSHEGSSSVVSTGGTTDLDRGSIITANGDLNASKDFTFGATIKFVLDSQAKHRWGYTDGTVTVDETANTVRSCFEINNATLYATTASGAGKTQTDVSSGVTLTNYTTYKIVRVGSSIYYYIDDALVATHTTTLVTSSADQLVFTSYMSGTGSVTSSMRIRNNFILQQEH